MWHVSNIYDASVVTLHRVNMSYILHKLLGLPNPIHHCTHLLLIVFPLPPSSSNRVSPRADKISIFISLSKFLICPFSE